MYQHKIYAIWSGMKDRCRNPQHISYKNYGGRGISVCDKWQTFQGFYEDMWDSYQEHHNTHGDNTSLERIDNDKGYFPDNCCWITKGQQSRNRRPRTIIEINGIRKSLNDWASEAGITTSAMYERLCDGVPKELLLLPHYELKRRLKAMRAYPALEELKKRKQER